MLIFLSLIEAHKWAQLGNLKNIRDSLGHTAKEGVCGGSRLLENKISKMFLYNLCCTCLNGFPFDICIIFREADQTSHSVLWET